MTREQLKNNAKIHYLSEERAREWAWALKLNDGPFTCPNCGEKEYYRHHSRPEVRTCCDCLRQIRLRPGTIFENSRVSLSTWFRAIYWMINRNGRISTQELQHRLELTSYNTAWTLRRKIQETLKDPGKVQKYQRLLMMEQNSNQNLVKAS